MKNKVICYLWFIVLFFVTFAAGAQNAAADSIRNVIRNTKADTTKISSYNVLADQYKETAPDSAYYYARKATSIAIQINDNFGLANAEMTLGNVGIINSNYKDAILHFDNAIEFYTKAQSSGSKGSLEKIKNGLARAYASIGVVNSEVNNYSIALEYYLKALKIYQEIHQKNSISKAYNNIGIIYKSQKNYSKAIDYLQKALQIQNELKESTLPVTLTNIGAIYFEQGKLDLAWSYYTKAKSEFDKTEKSRNYGLLLNYMAEFYTAKGNNDEALLYYNEALASYKQLENLFGAALVNYNLGEFYFKQKKYQEAMPFASKSLELAKQIGALDQTLHAEKLMSDLYALLGNPTASLAHYKSYITVKDSLNNEEQNKKMLQAELRFEYQKKEALLVESNKRQNLFTWFAIIGGLLLLGLIFVTYNRLQIKRRLTLQKEVAEYEQKALHLQMNPHFVFNCLGSISSFIVQNGTDSAIKYLSKFSKLMRLTLEYSKGKLIPIDAEIESLQNYLELEQLRFNNKFEFSIHSSSSLEDDMALPPLLVQPFVENAILHGIVPKEGNGRIEINFNVIQNQLICTITDDGIGINQSKANKENSVKAHQSMALEITKKRLEMMETTSMQKANVTIEEIINIDNQVIGTKVIITLPVQYLSETATKI
ncbi:MAG: tetratricopeptide repeat protein [Flavobacterium sp.]|nr:tetratricopeptide repeat protein [Flavobacterium sp.]